MTEYSRYSPIGGGTPIYDQSLVDDWTEDGFLTKEDAIWLAELCAIVDEKYPNRQKRQRYEILSLWQTTGEQ